LFSSCQAGLGPSSGTIGINPISPSGGWFPVSGIKLSLESMVAILNAWQFIYVQQVPVTVNVTVVNESPYTSAILSYRIINLDTNVTVRNWTSGEPVQISPYNTTVLIINTVVPIQRSFEPENFKLEVKLSQIGEDIQAETTFTVEKGSVQQFFGNVGLGSVCLVLAGLALYSYHEAKPKPWLKYPTKQNTKAYPKREGDRKKYPIEQKKREYPTRKGKTE